MQPVGLGGLGELRLWRWSGGRTFIHSLPHTYRLIFSLFRTYSLNVEENIYQQSLQDPRNALFTGTFTLSQNE